MNQDLRQQLRSPWAASTTHLLEMGRKSTKAHFAFAWTLHPSEPLQALSVGLTPEALRELEQHQHKAAKPTVIERLCEICQRKLRAVRLRDLEPLNFSEEFCPISLLNQQKRITDLWATATHAQGKGTKLLAFFRWGESAEPFSDEEDRTLEELVSAIPDQSLWQGLEPNQTMELRRLSEAEQRVLKYLQEPQTEMQIADQLDRSPHTIHAHVKSIYLKYGVSSRRELLARIQTQSQMAGE